MCPHDIFMTNNVSILFKVYRLVWVDLVLNEEKKREKKKKKEKKRKKKRKKEKKREKKRKKEKTIRALPI